MAAIHYAEKGQGFPIILIHGFCENHLIWEEVTPHLSREFRVIAIDLPGFGKSKPIKAPHSIDDVAHAILDFISNDLKLDSCIVLGHSLGGYVVLAMADLQENLFAGIGLIHSTANADLPERKVARNKVIEFVSTHGVIPFVQSFIPPLYFNQTSPTVDRTVERAASTPRATLLSYTEAMRDRPDRNHVLKRFTRPVLFLAGKHDTMIPLETVQIQSLRANHPHVLVLEKSAHMGMLEQVNETSEAILSFVRLTKGPGIRPERD